MKNGMVRITMTLDELIPQHLAKRFTEHAEEAIKHSLRVAKTNPQAKNPQQITSAHLLYGLASRGGSVAKNVLAHSGITKDAVFRYLQKNCGEKMITNSQSTISPTYKKILKGAVSCALENGQYFIGTEHILWSILKYDKETALLSATKVRALQNYLEDIMLSSMSADALAASAPHIMHKGNSRLEEEHFMSDGFETERTVTRVKEKKKSTLAEFCVELTGAARRGELDPVVGRETELTRIVRTLSRRNKSNPLLVGEAGVGKTALVNGLAAKIASNNVPANLQNKRVYALNLSSLIAGTMFRGEFEERMRDLVEEASREDIILFIDEMHTLVGAGSAQGSMDAANILKPALVRGDFQCIGATTFDEYKKSVEKDGALERRFQKIIVRAETPEQSIQTLMRLKPLYERHHDVEIPESAVRMAVELSEKYMPARNLPDKALDVLDEAATLVRSNFKGMKRIPHIAELEEQLAEIILQKDTALNHKFYKKALELKSRQEVLERAIATYREANDGAARPVVKDEAVYEAAAEMAGVPVSHIRDDERVNLKNLEKTLRKDIIGQDEAIKRVAASIRRGRVGVTKHSRPVGSFLFLGPSGVGKTELARVLARTMAGAKTIAPQSTPHTLIRLDMSEFAEPHSASRLIGAPPGYIGYEEAGHLTDLIRRTPYSVVLLDEIEKAHPRIFNLLLQILEDGTLTDSHGRMANFKNAIIIMTSNIGTERLNPDARLGFSTSLRDDTEQTALSSLKDILRPEIINRIGAIIVFRPLGEKELVRIAQLQLAELKERIAQNIRLEVSPEVTQWIVKKAKNGAGARGIRTAIEREIEEKIAEEIIRKNLSHIHISLRGKNLILKTK